MKALSLILILFACLGACVSVPPLTERAKTVREIPSSLAKDCKFIKMVEFNHRTFALSRNSNSMTALGNAGIQNAVAETGANAFVLVGNDSNAFTETVDYKAEAYRCP